jgi:hypothetical protein
MAAQKKKPTIVFIVAVSIIGSKAARCHLYWLVRPKEDGQLMVLNATMLDG